MTRRTNAVALRPKRSRVGVVAGVLSLACAVLSFFLAAQVSFERKEKEERTRQDIQMVARFVALRERIVETSNFAEAFLLSGRGDRLSHYQQLGPLIGREIADLRKQVQGSEKQTALLMSVDGQV